MAARIRRPSLLGGLLWATLGVLFLLSNLKIGPDVWALAGRWWPILLILLGLGKVIDHFRSKEGVSIRAGEIVGIVLLLLVGSLVTRVSRSNVVQMLRDIPIQIGGTSVRPGHWLGTSHAYSQDATYPLPAALGIRIDNSYGQVSLLPGADGEIRVRLRKVVYEDDEARAKAFADEIRLEAGVDSTAPAGAVPKPEAEPSPTARSGVFLVRTNRDSLAARNYRFNTDLEVYVPKKVPVELLNSFGEARASGLEGGLRMTTSHNPLEVRDCSGAIEVSNRYAETRLLNIAGKATVNARGRVNAEDIRGDLVVRSEYSPVEVRGAEGLVNISNLDSSVLVEKASKAVVIEAQGCQVTARSLNDTLRIVSSHKRIQVSDVAAGVSLNTRYATVTLKDIRGKVDIESNSDRLDIDGIRGGLQVKGTSSSIQASDITGPVEIATTLKDVTVNNFAGACTVSNEYGDVLLSTSTPGKGEWKVKNKNGNIQIFLPKDAGFQIDATARNGQVESDFPGIAPSGSQAGGASLKGLARGGGTKITAETEYSNIHLRTRDDDTARSRRELEESPDRGIQPPTPPSPPKVMERTLER